MVNNDWTTASVSSIWSNPGLNSSRPSSFMPLVRVERANTSWGMSLLTNPRHAWVARVTTIGLCVCLQQLLDYRLRGGPWAIQTASECTWAGKIFSWNDCVWEIYRENKWKSWLYNCLPWPVQLAPCTFEAQEDTTKGVCRLPHAISTSHCQTLCKLLALRQQLNAYHKLAVYT